ncbi:MAG: archease, partial [Chloroflexota bacterium]
MTDQPFDILEHTGEAGIVAHGATLAEAFANAAQGLTATMTDLDAVRERETREVAAEAPDREALLVEFLNELVFLFDTQGFLARRAEVLEMDATHLR